MNSTALPTFIIIGAAKSGTTSLYDFLVQHPEVFMSSIKEPRFFKFEGQTIDPKDPVNQSVITKFADYQALFKDAGDYKVIGEASPAYLAAEGVPEKMHHYLPEVDLYLMARNPIDRAFSHYVFAVKQGYEPVDLTFEEALRTDTVTYNGFERKRPYLENGFYNRHLERYDAVYGPNKVKVLFFEDLRKDPLAFAQQFYQRIGVDADFEPNTGTQFAKSGLPKNKVVHQLIKGNNPIKSLAKQLVPKQYRKRLKTNIENRNLEKPSFPEHLRAELIERYADDVQALAKRTGRNLDHWLK